MAVQSLATAHDRVTIEILRQALSDPDEKIRKVAAEALKKYDKGR